MNKLVVILPLFLLSMCSDAPVTPPAGACSLPLDGSPANCPDERDLILIIPLFFITMCGEAPVTPPAGALEVEGGVEKGYAIVNHLQNYQREENMTDPDDAINNALEQFWEGQDGSNGSTEQEELL